MIGVLTMAQYKITITNQKPLFQEPLEIHEYDGSLCFSKSMYENTVASMFFYAAQSIDYKCLDAFVERYGQEVLHFVMDTIVDGSTIDAILTAARPREKYRFIRMMNIVS